MVKNQTNEEKMKRIEHLRNMKARGSKLPNIRTKIEASRVLDSKDGNTPITLPGPRNPDEPCRGDRNIQKDTGPVLVGNDVEALFPSIKDVEGARMVRCALEKSDIIIEGFDHLTALQYLRLVGGKGYLKSVGLGRLEPRWRGKRCDLLSLGGDKSKENANWNNYRGVIGEKEKRAIVSRTVEVAILVAMGHHLYSFGGKIYLQAGGGPIGMRFTACLAAAIMKIWDMAWIDLMEREGLVSYLYKRYVDDSRNLLPPLKEGWIWDGCCFKFCEDQYINDMSNTSTMNDQIRTTTELTKAMCSLVNFLKFTGEDYTQFDGRLPTLDTNMWVSESKVLFSFYEKPTVPNRVLDRLTALSDSALNASMIQEVVRRLKLCSNEVSLNEKKVILDTFSQKLINSNYSVGEARKILVHGATKYVDCVRRSKLDVEDCEYSPLHLPKTFRESRRQIDKYLAKQEYYKDTTNHMKDSKPNWRRRINKEWKSRGIVQSRLRGMDFSTVMQVPCTEDSTLLKSLIHREHKIAKLCGYQVKYTEQSGVKLVSLFNR